MSAFRGKNRKKGDLSLFLVALETGQLEAEPVLILEDLDRLSRDKIMASVDVARKILEAGCDIYSVIERKLYTREALEDPMGLMGLIWRFYLAHEESAKKADRARQNWQQKHKEAADGKLLNRICPAWLRAVDYEMVNNRLVGGRFEPIPERVAVVRKIFKWCIEGYGIQSIMRKLVAEDIKPFKSGWSQKYIWQILRDRRVLGELTTNLYGEEIKKGVAIQGYYPVIVSQTTFDRAQDDMVSRKNKRGRRGDFLNLFTGIVRYPEHDCNMIFLSKPKRTKSGVHPYKYLASFKGWKGHYPYIAIRYDRFEEIILRWVHELSPSDLVQAEDQDDSVDALRARKKLMEERIKAVADQLENYEADVPTVMNKLAEMNVKLTKLTQEIETKQREQSRPSIEETKSLVDMLSSATGPELRELRERVRQRLLLLIDRIDVRVVDHIVKLNIYLRSGIVRPVWYDTTSERSKTPYTAEQIQRNRMALDRIQG